MKDQNREAIAMRSYSPLQLLQLESLERPDKPRKMILTYTGKDCWGQNERRGYDII